MKPILCAIDFSESSLSVVKMAVELANLYNIPVIILYSFRLVQSEKMSVPEYRKSMEMRARKDFENLLKKLNVSDSVKYEFRCEIGFLTDRIEAFTEKSDVGMIVLSQDLADSINDHKELSFQHFISAAKTPLLIVPKETTS